MLQEIASPVERTSVGNRSASVAGIAIAIFPGVLLGSFPHPNLVARKLDQPAITRDVHLITRAEHSLSPAAESFIDLGYSRIDSPGHTQAK